MPDIRVKILKEETYTRFLCRGAASIDGYRHVIDCVRKTMADPAAGRKALVDITGVDGEVPEMQKFSLGETIASRLSGLRIGVIMNRKTPLTRFGENTAVNRGADLLVSHETDEVLAWLGCPAPAGTGVPGPADAA